ncbi:MAG: acetylglutamate kinase [Armatimonadetes bacterium]|nr:acetylglutamate kinase [Candidatus Hippobium faecium]
MRYTEEMAQLLVEALPYIQKYSKKIIVVKYGGNAMVNEEIKANVIKDIMLLHYCGMKPILVHGGGPDINAMMDKLGLEPKFVEGKRVTDEKTMEIVEMVLAGKTNSGIVSLINSMGGRAVGLSGKDASLISASVMNEKWGLVGKVDSINPKILHDLLDAEYIPVVSSVAIGEEGESYNINADHIAGEIAAAVGAEKLIMMTDVDGLYRDFEDKNSLIVRMDLKEAEELVRSKSLKGGMIPKVEACVKALKGKVKRTHIINGTVRHSILMEIFTDGGSGTMIYDMQ